MKNTNYETVVGMEIHVELSTATKMFCRCPFPTLQDQPNTLTCPICLGLPGALPFPNKQAIESCIQIGLALNCKINKDSFFERKNYFYPDLSKGFQISQYLHPFGEKGYLDIKINGVEKRIGITRVHMEEDTGKLTHATVKGREVSLIDFNRSSVPLVEIVTEPDIRSGEEAKLFLTELQKIIRYLGVSDADMEKGHMRLEPNISLRPPGQTTLPKYKVEVKNINSFKFVDKAIQYEEKRHEELLDKGETPIQETRGWNEFKNKTVSQRSKEEAHDYRYFPEPDIPPIKITQDQISEIENKIPELPAEKIKRFAIDYGITEYNAEILTRDLKLAHFFEEAISVGIAYNIVPLTIANYIINKKPNIEELLPATLVKKIKEESTVLQIDNNVLESAIRTVMEKNPQAVADYKSGKVQIIGFLIGQTRQVLPNAKDTEQIRKKLTEMLE
ncbi:MAG: Asp-tRNA(Asn)/Glu-tRNA(Gln) amidotransferase subunit GatB [Candidatus Levybacteria bacterium]|nr:Asp-tRNA(Asn)/Glu-tRNA(Gln) amidotransferase subunit GatB [Candidatus Levybacteria bacterium]